MKKCSLHWRHLVSFEFTRQWYDQERQKLDAQLAPQEEAIWTNSNVYCGSPGNPVLFLAIVGRRTGVSQSSDLSANGHVMGFIPVCLVYLLNAALKIRVDARSSGALWGCLASGRRHEDSGEISQRIWGQGENIRR